MILPVVAYGDPVLNKVAEEIDQDYPGLEPLIANMYETMYNAQGVGLAAPQIGRSIHCAGGIIALLLLFSHERWLRLIDL